MTLGCLTSRRQIVEMPGWGQVPVGTSSLSRFYELKAFWRIRAEACESLPGTFEVEVT
jgi:hypothetical protein